MSSTTNPGTIPDPTEVRAVGATVLGYPRQGRDRELKKAIERYWAGRLDRAGLDAAIGAVRAQRRDAMRGLDEVPVGDFSLYDHVLDTAVLFGAVPPRYADVQGDEVDLMFAMARGTADLVPLEMTKWFDTNYHYLVPELDDTVAWTLHPDRLLAEVAETIADGLRPRVVLVGPVTFLALAKPSDTAAEGFDPLSLLDGLLPHYVDLLQRLAAAGVEWVQLDEPVLATDLPEETLAALERAYATLAAATDRPRLLVAVPFGHLGAAADRVLALPVDGFGLDLVTDPALTVEQLSTRDLTGRRLLAGVVHGHNVWRADLDAAITTVTAVRRSGADVDVASSTSLLHVPIDASRETAVDPEVRAWLAFADQKIAEIVTIARGVGDHASVAAEIDEAATALEARRVSPLTHDDGIRAKVAAVTEDDLVRRSGYTERSAAQHERFGLPPLPITTIGSFPQTTAIRTARSAHAKGRLDDAGYTEAMRQEVTEVVRAQEELGLDVLVHGEPERNDMVQYFADLLTGVISTEHGWVQSYGTRCVRPPIIAGDVSRRAPITVEWSTFAQGLTDRPMKGMLTGPVTMLAWSFVRDDQPRGETARQMALALREEVLDLEQAGIGVIQVDEPALRETLPLREADRPAYLRWAVDAFRLTTAGVADRTQIHTHMCYAEFGDIIQAIIDIDADVISLEATRSRMEIVADLASVDYPREVGPGVWDIHSPRVPAVDEVVEHLRTAVTHLPPERIWVNPDCGLKTRAWPETSASLENLVAATRIVREELAQGA